MPENKKILVYSIEELKLFDYNSLRNMIQNLNEFYNQERCKIMSEIKSREPKKKRKEKKSD